MGYKLDNNMKTPLCTKALAMTKKIENTLVKNQFIIQTKDFNIVILKILNLSKKNGITMRRTAQYDPYGNAIAEGINRILKYE